MSFPDAISPVRMHPHHDRFCRAPLVRSDRGALLTRCLSSDPGMWYMLFVPEVLRPDTPLLVSIHGISRNAIEHATWFAPWADAYGAVLVVPVFSADRFRDYQSLAGRRNVGRADAALEAVLGEVSTLVQLPPSPIRLFGYSAGAQFAHRFALAYPHRIMRMGLGAAGRYTFPDEAVKYPRGVANMLRRIGVSANIEELCRLPIRVWVGELDTESDAKLSRNRRVVEQQGPHRVARGLRWVEAVSESAVSLGIPPNVEFSFVPGADHSFAMCAGRGMVAEVAAFLLGA